MREWTWNESRLGREGMTCERTRLVWFVEGQPGLRDFSREQPAAEFLCKGPPVDGVSESVVAELRAHLRQQ